MGWFTLIWMLEASCKAALLIVPYSHLPKQNWTVHGLAKFKDSPTQVREVMAALYNPRHA